MKSVEVVAFWLADGEFLPKLGHRPRGICGGQICAETDFPPSAAVFPLFVSLDTVPDT